MIRELFKDLAKYLPSIVVPAIVGIIVLPIITRLFSPEEYGNYVLVTVTVSFVSCIAVSWLDSSTLRFSPVYELNNELSKFYSVLLKLALVSIATVCVIFLGVLYLSRAYISDSLYFLMHIGILLFIVTSFSSVFQQSLRAKRRVTWYTSFSIWSSVAGIGLGIALVMIFHFEVEGLLLGALLTILVALPLMWKISMGKPSLRAGSIRSPMSWEMAKYGFPVAMVGLSSLVLRLSDRYIVELFRGSQEVGIYSASYSISEKSMFLIVSLFASAYTPIAFNIWEHQGSDASRDYMSKLARYYLLIGLPAAVGLSLLAKPVVDILAASEYYLGYRILPMVAFGVFLVGAMNVFSEGLAFYKRTDLLMYCFLGSGLLNIGLNFIFIPNYGYIAAAATTFVSYAFLLLLTILVSRRFFVWRFPFKSLGRVALASVIMGAIVYPMGNSLTSSSLINLAIGIISGISVYGAVLFAFGEIRPNEKRVMKQLLARYLPGRLIPNGWKVQE